MSFRVKVTSNFEKAAKPLLKKYSSLKNDLLILINQLEITPDLGVALGGGLFKIRLAIKSKGRGKSGGARIITFIIKKESLVYLVSVYDKAELDAVKVTELLKILKEEGL